MTTIRLNLPAIKALSESGIFDKTLDELGEGIASDARDAAPKRTGEGAASIHHEIGHDQRGTYVRISWDASHWYMIFAELGTSKETARPFLRPAALKHRSL